MNGARLSVGASVSEWNCVCECASVGNKRRIHLFRWYDKRKVLLCIYGSFSCRNNCCTNEHDGVAKLTCLLSVADSFQFMSCEHSHTPHIHSHTPHTAASTHKMLSKNRGNSNRYNASAFQNRFVLNSESGLWAALFKCNNEKYFSCRVPTK